jgi:hypothetical protein
VVIHGGIGETRGMEQTVAATPLRLALELRPQAGRLAGALVDERGAEHRFTGWLALLTLLEAARARAER